MKRERFTFRVRTADGRFEAEARAEWRELDVAYHLLVIELVRHDGFVISLDEVQAICGLTRRELERQLRICAIAAGRERELDPTRKPTMCIACNPVRETSGPATIEGRLVA